MLSEWRDWYRRTVVIQFSLPWVTMADVPAPADTLATKGHRAIARASALASVRTDPWGPRANWPDAPGETITTLEPRLYNHPVYGRMIHVYRPVSLSGGLFPCPLFRRESFGFGNLLVTIRRHTAGKI